MKRASDGRAVISTYIGPICSGQYRFHAGHIFGNGIDTAGRLIDDGNIHPKKVRAKHAKHDRRQPSDTDPKSDYDKSLEKVITDAAAWKERQELIKVNAPTDETKINKLVSALHLAPILENIPQSAVKPSDRDMIFASLPHPKAVLSSRSRKRRLGR